MRLIDALGLSRQASHPDRGALFRLYIASGFTPLHLKPYLTAHLGQRLPERRIEIQTGVFGDLPGSLEAAAGAGAAAVAVFIEWADLDPRLSIRQVAAAGGVSADDMVRTVRENARRLRLRIETLRAAGPVVISLPGVAPLWHSYQPEALETDAQRDLDAVVRQLSQECAQAGARVLSATALDRRSPVAGRHDLKAELQSGFPYTLPHVAELAALMAQLLAPAVPKKAIITDLDDTLWSGIVGEIGPEQVAWNLDGHASVHGHYQQALTALATAGVLIGVASKNDAAVAGQALARPDLVIPRANLFPVEAHWTPKSESVGRMLHAWNIGAEAVIFIDDSPMELAEVQQKFPAITCLRFPKEDPAAVVELLGTLRNLCGRMQVSAEDGLRRESLERRQEFLAESEETDTEAFLQSLQARVVLQDGTQDARSLELVNKTNQFNLHGLRYTEDEWRTWGQREGAFIWTVSYEDRFGALGKIAVLAGERKGHRIRLRDMVLSCRAFSRRVEHAAVQAVLRAHNAAEIEFQYRATDRNSPTREFLSTWFAPLPAEGTLVLTSADFDAQVPKLYQEIIQKTNV